MKHFATYIHIISLIKSKKHVSLFLESRNTPRDKDDTLTSQTHIMVHDNMLNKQLLMAVYNDRNPDEIKRVEKDLADLEKNLGSADKDVLKKYEKYLRIYQGLLTYTRRYKHLVFKLTMIQLKEKQTSWSIEDLRLPAEEAQATFVDEDQPESYPELVSYVNALMKQDTHTQEDSNMDIL